MEELRWVRRGVVDRKGKVAGEEGSGKRAMELWVVVLSGSLSGCRRTTVGIGGWVMGEEPSPEDARAAPKRVSRMNQLAVGLPTLSRMPRPRAMGVFCTGLGMGGGRYELLARVLQFR